MSTLQEYEQIAAAGKTIGLTGADLVQFVEKQLETRHRQARDERAEERECKKQQAQIEQEGRYRRLQLEADEKEKQREYDEKERNKQREYDEEERNKQRDHEEKLKLHDIEMEKVKVNAATGTSASTPATGTSSSWIPKGPKLPHFDERTDDMDSYIRRFERYAISNHWEPENYATFMSALLKGSALEVYSRMASTDVNDYGKLKSALLKKFHMTEEGYRKKFHGTKMESGETATQYIAKLTDYFNRWTELAEVGSTFKELQEFIISEQFLHSCPEEITVFIREHEVRKLEEISKLADNYITAHSKSINRIRNVQVKGKQQSSNPNTTNLKGANSTQNIPHSDRRSDDRGYVKREFECWLCSEKGHRAKDCKLKRKITAAAIRIIDKEDTDENDEALVIATSLIIENKHKCKHNSRKQMSRIPDIGEKHVLPEDDKIIKGLPTTKGIVNNQQVTILRDTGCTGAIIKKSLIKPQQFTGKRNNYITVNRTIHSAPEAEVYLECSMFTGIIKALCIEEPLCDVILGNLPQVIQQSNDFIALQKLPQENPRIGFINSNSKGGSHTTGKLIKTKPVKNNPPVIAQAVMTRQAVIKDEQVKKLKLLKVPGLPHIGSAEQFQQEQENDESLHQARKWAEIKKTKTNSSSQSIVKFQVIKHLLYRIITSMDGKIIKEEQLVIPKKYRNTVMKLGHEGLMAGHMGITKTTDRIQASFYWPNLQDDVTRYCKTCDACQRTIPKGRVPKAPLQKMPIIMKPFNRVAVDLVGPLFPRTKKGNKYILTMVDIATGYPKATALAGIDTATVAEALVTMFCDIGIPREVLSDRGTQFTSEMMEEVQRLLSIRSVRTSPYHAQCNGKCEKYNGTLKQMLRRMIEDQETDWDRFIEPLLFAYREAPIESIGGFSPFEMIYGGPVRGPMAILKELWSNEEVEEETKDTYEYVLDLRKRLEKTCEIAAEALAKAQKSQKFYFDKKTEVRTLKSGDEVLILLPTDNNKLMMKWKGPFLVKDQVGVCNYAIEIGDNTKIFHINMLKQYFRPIEESVKVAVSTIAIDSEDEEQGEIFLLHKEKEVENHRMININPLLSDKQKQDVRKLAEEYTDIFSSLPGTTHLEEHKITLMDKDPVRSKSYPVPYGLYDALKEEIDDMLKIGVIEPSDSPYCSPIVLVKKKDGSLRPCQDMRQINKITKFDCESLPDPEAIYANLHGAKYLTKLDFCKGYWQIPMEESSKEITAFSTPFGHYQFKKMPFGLVNSGATYNRMMRKLLKNLNNVENFVDDVLEHTVEWSDHVTIMRTLFQRIREAKLTVKPSKCFFGYGAIDFTGHRITEGMLMTMEDKIEKIRLAPVPKTKKQLRSLLGLTGYYRKFIPNYAEKVKPLTDLTKGKEPNNIRWKVEHDIVLKELKTEMCKQPILKLPDPEKQFTLRTDASDTGIGAVLLQKHNETLFPVAYISKKLLPRECNYSVIEKECLAIVWAIKKFHVYLFGQKFVLQTDHQSLAYLSRAKFSNQRVMRWALSLQPYNYTVEYIKGEENHGADFLSRAF